MYDLNNPHPGFGKDPNIKNEFGHTHYPKWIDNPDGSKDKKGRPNKILVQDKAEHEKVLGKKVKEPKPDVPQAWGNGNSGQ